ncbi:MAG: hypothetical protein R2704_03235 [Microthrixaceae bacterium]
MLRLRAAAALGRDGRCPQAGDPLAGETIFRYVFGSIYGMGAFNGDPHRQLSL